MYVKIALIFFSAIISYMLPNGWDKFTALVDTREQTPLNLYPLKFKRAGLKTGDYSIEGYENQIVVERKSLNDFVACITRERARFERELERMAEIEHRCVAIEADPSHVICEKYISKVKWNSVLHSTYSWMIKYKVPFVYCYDHDHTADFVTYYLSKFYYEKNGPSVGRLKKNHNREKEKVTVS